MAVTYKPQDVEAHDSWHLQEVQEQHKCFYCSSPLKEFPVVGWRGGHGKDGAVDIVMHPECANNLVLQLAADVYEVRSGHRRR